MAPRIYGLVFLALVIVGTPSLQAQPSYSWRVYNASDGLKESFATAVTIGPRGTVWVKHSETEAISSLDGYSVSNIVASASGAHQIHESRSGQIWAIYTDGIQEHREGQWIKYPVAEIRAENQTNLLRRVRPISLLPAEVEHVLFLLSDRLMEFNGASRQASVLRRVQDTKLGRFLDLSAARDGGAWLSGSRGVAKLPTPIRKLTAQTEWTEFLVDESLQVQNLQRPFEDDEQHLTAVADSLALNRKVLVYFDGQSWSSQFIPGENIRLAWGGLEATFWAMTIKSLFHFPAGQRQVVEKESFSTGQNFDAATDLKGVFWLATSEGLLRWAPLPWRTPPGVAGINSLVTGITEDAQGRLWFVSADDLIVKEAGRWTTYALPKEGETSLQKRTPLVALPSGQISFNLNDRLLLFTPKTREFAYVAHRSGRSVKLIGKLKDGRICVQTYEQDPDLGGMTVDAFDGLSFEPFLTLPENWKGANELLFLHETQNGDVWVGGTAKLGFYHQEEWKTFGAAEGFSSVGAHCILEAHDGRIWCGSRDKLYQFDGRKWSIERSFFDRVNAISGDREGGIWVASNSGLYRYLSGSWILNSIEEGLPSAVVYDVYQSGPGQMWAGTGRGVSLYHLDADVDPPITSIETRNSKIKPSAEGIISVEFSGLDKWKYTSVERLLYSYRLDDGQWSPYNSTTAASFTNLASGHHRLTVKAMDRNWNADPKPPSFEFMVILPWFKDPRLIAISICALGGVLFFAWLAFNRHRQLVRSYSEVEQIVAQRTRELETANQELLHSQKMTALGTFAAGIAHDFNNILSIIKGSAQIIESNLEDKEKIRTRVKRIRSVVDQGAGIVKAILGYSRASAKEVATYDLAAVIEETIKLLGDRFLRGINLRVESGATLPRVSGAKDLIQQILLNLILNAEDAMEGDGEILLRTGRLATLPAHLALQPAKASEYAFVAVQDSGCGVPAEIQPRIFEPFFTTKDFSTKRGTGLGLYTVYEFATELGYGIMVESVVGQGSTFTIIIPLTGNEGPHST
jgi:signal transduction histidine kinase/ligand-binding sensor domain-containing protein